MRKVNLEGRYYTLIGCGCSHTQGSAYVQLGDNMEWVNEKVAEKFKDIPCTPEYITENLTWMGKLKDHINIKQIYNFGFAGSGTTSTLRALKNYIAKNNRFDDVLVIVQISNAIRDEIHFRETLESKWETINLKGIIHHKPDLPQKVDFEYCDFLETYLNNFINLDFRVLDYLYELYYLQKTFETLGGNFRVFYGPFGDLNISLKSISEYENAYYKRYTSLGFERDVQGIIPPMEMLDKLNIIRVVPEKSSDYTLHSEGLVDGDRHLNDVGNGILASAIYAGINTKYDFLVK